MFSSSSTILLTLLATLASTANAHGTITAITGANGVTSAGMGILASTPRDGSGRTPFQQDTSTIRDREIASGRTGPCGRTIAGGNNDVAAEVASASSDGLPSMSEDGTVTMTLHQINQDGGGPYTCDISTDASGTNFQPMTVTQQVPGILGFSAATAQDFPLVAQAPAGTTCTGGPNGDACLVRCRNNTPAGPFGSCATVTNPESGSVSAQAVPAAAAGGGGGRAGGRFGGLGRLFNRSVVEAKKRVVNSRFVQRDQAGKWI
ncbi:hypothetical protein FRC15_003924 [Serendipita sp. 397]|nr:hypothetical protein FRC15_003924 [Serendipita sp. 397]KAG8774170.1 hypothetical protein FRC16_005177 [Serendipita sp. 398]